MTDESTAPALRSIVGNTSSTVKSIWLPASVPRPMCRARFRMSSFCRL
jgi:hypothetical protein